MPEVNNSKPTYGRTFTIGRETDDKTSKPHFMEWVKEIPADKPQGAKYRTKTSQNGNQRNYRLFGGWSGHLVGLKRDNKEFGAGKAEQTLFVTMQDVSGDVTIELPFFETYAGDLMKRLLDKNFDPSLNLALAPYAINKENGRGQNIGVSAVSGADCNLAGNARAYGNKPAAPHLAEMPDLKRLEIRGTVTYDCTDQHEWLWTQLQRTVIPRLSSLGGAATPNGGPKQPQMETTRTPMQKAKASLGNDWVPEVDTTNYENAEPAYGEPLPF